MMRKCPVRFCECGISGHRLMCPLHWQLVPQDLRVRVALSRSRVEAVRSVNAVLGNQGGCFHG